MEITSHPSIQLTKDQVNIIRNYAAAAEEQGQLQPAQLELVYEQQWFKMLVPKQYRGLELTLPNEVRQIEALSWADGSMGWAVTLCTGAGWFGGFLNPALSERIFADRKVCLAGSGAPGGTATITGDGYTISGSWKYASGALHATHLTANCLIVKDNEQVLNADGEPLILPFIFDRADVNILTAWNYTGMVATGSHSFEVKDLYVQADRCFKIDPEFALVKNTLYQYPFLQLAEATLAVNISGMAIHFMDLCAGIFGERKATRQRLTESHKQELDYILDYSKIKMNRVREEFYIVADRSWLDYDTEDNLNREQNLKQVSLLSRDLAKTARQIVDELFPYCGLIAASKSSEINRVWRDVHTASQHALLTFSE